MALAFLPLILIFVVALIGIFSFIKGGSLINIETMMEGGAKAAIEEAVQAKGETTIEYLDVTVDEVPVGDYSLSRTCLHTYVLRYVRTCSGERD